MTRPTTRGEIEGDQIQAHSQGGNLGGSDPGPQQRGKLRGIRYRPTVKGEIEGDQIRPPPDSYCCGQYASYWNAFLFQLQLQMVAALSLIPATSECWRGVGVCSLPFTITFTSIIPHIIPPPPFWRFRQTWWYIESMDNLWQLKFFFHRIAFHNVTFHWISGIEISRSKRILHCDSLDVTCSALFSHEKYCLPTVRFTFIIHVLYFRVQHCH